MENLLAMFETCSNSPAYISLPQDAAAFAALRDKLLSAAPDSFLELEALANAYGSTSTQEGFINGWAWAQATAKECLALRKLPALTCDYGPEKSCATCRYFVLHFRYENQYPWYQPVGCGHCTAPDQEKRTLHRDPTWRGCVDWRKRDC